MLYLAWGGEGGVCYMFPGSAFFLHFTQDRSADAKPLLERRILRPVARGLPWEEWRIFAAQSTALSIRAQVADALMILKSFPAAKFIILKSTLNEI